MNLVGYTPEFWAEVIRQIHGLINNGFPMFPAVHAVFHENVDAMKARYPKPLKINVSLESLPYLGKGTMVPFACAIVDGEPNISIFVPCLLNTFADLKANSQHLQSLPQDVFQTTLVVRIMHEFDHLGLGVFAPIVAGVDMAEVVKAEKVVWGRTCAKTMLPLVYTHGRELAFSDNLLKSAWVQCFQSVESQEWHDFVTKFCGLTTKMD